MQENGMEEILNQGNNSQTRIELFGVNNGLVRSALDICISLMV